MMALVTSVLSLAAETDAFDRPHSPEDRGRYESAEDEAKARGWGLWADPNPINPYEWRKGKR